MEKKMETTGIIGVIGIILGFILGVRAYIVLLAENGTSHGTGKGHGN